MKFASMSLQRIELQKSWFQGELTFECGEKKLLQYGLFRNLQQEFRYCEIFMQRMGYRLWELFDRWVF